MRTRRSLPPGLAVLIAAVLAASLAPASAAGSPPTTPRLLSDSLLFISSATFGASPCLACTPRVCPGEPVLLGISGAFPNGCGRFLGLRVLSGADDVPVVEADFETNTGGGCPDVVVPFSGHVLLPPVAAGQHHVELLQIVRAALADSLSPPLFTGTHLLTFEVPVHCQVSVQLPLDSLIRTFTSLRIVPERPCVGDSLTLQLVKRGCPPCVHLTGLGADPDRGFVASVDWRPLCVEFACLPETLSHVLGAFAAGSFRLTVWTDVHVLLEAGADTTISYQTAVTFDVARTCDSTVTGCLHSPLPPFGVPIPECSVRVAPGGRGDALLPVRNTLQGLGIAGVGGFVSTFGPFRIVDIQYAGAAAGVHVSWRLDGSVASFLVFGSSPDVVPPGVSDLLRVTVEAESLVAAVVPAGTLHGALLSASGPNGEPIPFCAEPLRAVSPSLHLCIDTAAIGCDVNHDGTADIRDLVLMTRCLAVRPRDIPGDAVCFDCDGDGSFGIPDLFCCAREILHGPVISHDSTQVDPGLAVSMDPPSRDGDAVRLRLHVSGAGSLGAALLRLRYPADRWQVLPPAGLDAGFAAGWLPLVDASEAGLLRLGALRLGDPGASELVYELRAVPIPGAPQSGALSVEGADLAARDGTMLRPATALPSAEISPDAAASVLELTPARPNPFTLSTTFAIGLPREADVDLAVHDLAGRLIATLAHGRLAAGRRIYTWNGSGARDGVYFVRLTVDGRVLSTRVALLKGGR
ncbi:MAG TPA: T9SS type A sorting domain-containing protein [Candidatus Eisenbacteria bacterium]